MIEEPKNEMGVVVLFAEVCESYGVSIVNIQSAYPDALINMNGEYYRVEFEYYASNFLLHKHDPRNLVVCWIDDLKDRDFPLTVWQLSSRIDPVIKIYSDVEKEIAFLRSENKYLRRRLEVEKEVTEHTGARIEQTARTLKEELQRPPSVREIQQRLREQDGVEAGWSTSTINTHLKREG